MNTFLKKTAAIAGTTLVAAGGVNAKAPETVFFESEGAQVAGTLYLPEDYQADQTYPAVVIGGSLTAVKELMGARYGREMADRGIIALAIDYRNFGESGGQARQFDDPNEKAKDLSAAVTYLLSREDTTETSVGLLGICASGGAVLYAAANDARIGAVATVAGWFSEPSITPALYGGEEAVAELRSRGEAAWDAFDKTGQVEMILAYHDTDQTASHVGPMEYYMDQNRAAGVEAWKNEFAVMSWGPWLDFNAVSKASQVTSPTLIVHSDGSALPDQARKVHELLAGPKTLYWTEGAHMNFYDQDKEVTDASNAVAQHFKAYLS